MTYHAIEYISVVPLYNTKGKEKNTIHSFISCHSLCEKKEAQQVAEWVQGHCIANCLKIKLSCGFGNLEAVLDCFQLQAVTQKVRLPHTYCNLLPLVSSSYIGIVHLGPQHIWKVLHLGK